MRVICNKSERPLDQKGPALLESYRATEHVCSRHMKLVSNQRKAVDVTNIPNTNHLFKNILSTSELIPEWSDVLQQSDPHSKIFFSPFYLQQHQHAGKFIHQHPYLTLQQLPWCTNVTAPVEVDSCRVIIVEMNHEQLSTPHGLMYCTAVYHTHNSCHIHSEVKLPFSSLTGL